MFSGPRVMEFVEGYEEEALVLEGSGCIFN
jgi:hypothetical protein